MQHRASGIRHRASSRFLLIAWLAAAAPSTVLAQTTSGSTAPTGDEEAAFSVAYERHRDRLRYSFDTPSSFDTPFPVPHTYTQTYRADNHWLVLRARYTTSLGTFTSDAGITPRVTARASDIDTFYNPGNDVVTSGTDGDAHMRAWRLAQWGHGRVGRLPLRVGYKYRRDTADFAPADIVVTHSNPPAEHRRFTTDEEYTTSEVHEAALATSRTLAASTRWRIVGTVGASPLVVARLSTRLPQKYPEQVIRSVARGAAFTARLEAEAAAGALPIVVGVEWGTAVSYRASRSFDRDALELSVGWRW